MGNDIIVVEQLPIIKQQLQLIKEDVTERVTAALSLECTEETVKAVKKAKADLNNEFKAWEEKRKGVKSAIMSPYEQFEAVYKDCITDVFKTADNELKGKISSVENELKEKKATEVKAYFDEYAAARGIEVAYGAFFTFEQSGINITLSASLKSLKEQAKAFIDRICEDLNLIETQEHKEEILVEYKQTLNVSAAIASVSNRYKAIEAEKAREAERQQREQAAKEAENKVDEIVPPVVEPVLTAPTVEEADPVLTLKFSVTAPKSKLKELKKFLDERNYHYE